MILEVNIIFFQIRRIFLNFVIPTFLVLGAATPAQALGLGELRVQSALGQALKAQLALIGSDGNEFTPACIKAKVATTEGTFLANVSVAVRKIGPNESIFLSTRQGLNEPAVKITVDIQCDSQLHREFLILLDPPQIIPAADNPVIVSAIPTGQAQLETAGRLEQVPPRVLNDGLTATAKKLSDSTTGKRIRLSKPAKRPKDVLRLSDESFVIPRGLKISDSLSTSVEGQLVENIEELRAAQVRMAAMLRDENLDQRVNSEQVTGQKKLQDLQSELARLKIQNRTDRADLEEMRKNSFSRNWVIGLIALVLVGVIIIILLYMHFRRIQKDTEISWWEPGQEKREAERRKNIEEIVDDVQASYEPGAMLPESSSDDADRLLRPIPGAIREQTKFVSEEPTALDADQVFKRSTAGPRTPTLEETNSSTFNFFSNRGSSVKVEEISDVTQEAEFWMSVNDPQRAIEILDSQARVEHPDSPVPWLYLLDLYRLVQDKQKYDELRNRFIVFFNANIPTFEDKLISSGVRQLENFPHLIDRICHLWNGNEIIPFLQNLLVDDRDGTRIGFELPVYRDILLLISLAHELERIAAIEGPVTGGTKNDAGRNFDSGALAVSSGLNPGVIEFEVINFPKTEPPKE